MGKPSRDKGQREERKIVHEFQDAGLGAERIPLSGAAGGSFGGDVTIPIHGTDRLFEAKVRADGFKELYRWLGGNYGLFVRSDRNPSLVVLRTSDFIDLIKRAEALSRPI
jgi:hypothetical protein